MKENKNGKINGVALSSLVCSLLGTLTLTFSCGLVAIVTGVIGLVQFDKEKETGRWMAITGLVIGIIEVLFVLLFLVLLQSAKK